MVVMLQLYGSCLYVRVSVFLHVCKTTSSDGTQQIPLEKSALEFTVCMPRCVGAFINASRLYICSMCAFSDQMKVSLYVIFLYFLYICMVVHLNEVASLSFLR